MYLSICPEVQILTKGFIWLPAKRTSHLEAEQCWFDIQSCRALVPSCVKKDHKEEQKQ